MVSGVMDLEVGDALTLDDLRLGDPELLQTYDQCCSNLAGIDRKLANPKVPERKKEAMRFHRKSLDRKMSILADQILQTRI